MPLWAAGLTLFLCAALSVMSFKRYRSGGKKVFLAGGIAFLSVFLAAALYFLAAAALLSGIE